MSLEQIFPTSSAIVVKQADFSTLSRSFGRRYSQKITCHLLVVFEALLIAGLQFAIIANPLQEPFVGLRFAIVSGTATGAIALASALWAGAATFDRFESYMALLPGAVATSAFAASVAFIGGASIPYVAVCATVLFAAVFLARIPSRLLKSMLLARGRLTRLAAVVADEPVERESAFTVLARREDIEVVFSGPPTEFDTLRALSQENMLDEIVLVGPHVLAEDIEKMAGLAATLVRAAPFDRFEQRAINALRGIQKSPWNMQAVVLMKSPLEGWGGVFKRMLDILGSVTAIVLLSPVLLACAVAVKLGSRGPVLFIQERVGYRNKPFRMLKFRSMHAECADHTGSQLTLRADPRVTRLGKILRCSSADELPQLFNVLWGDMSLVGPRPHPKGAKAGGVLYDQLIPTFYSRYRVKPGITGLAQISGQRGNTETQQHLFDRFRSDLRYIGEWTPFLDIDILLRTVQHLFKRTNAF